MTIGRIRTGEELAGYAIRLPAQLDSRQLLLALESVQREEASRPDVPTFAEFAPRWINEYARANRHKPRGILSKESILRIHVLPRFGHRRLDSIATADVQQLKAHLAERAVSTCNNVLGVLSGMLSVAVEWGVLRALPCRISRLDPEDLELAFYAPETFEQLVAGAAAVGPEQLALVLLGGEAGLRMGEIIGLERRDVDVQLRKLHVRRSESQGIVTLPKSGKHRDVPITERLISAVQAVPDQGRGPRLFYRRDGHPATASTLRSWMTSAQKRSGLLDFPGRIHILRHTFCSRLAMAGAPSRTIQELAGHASLSTTERYMHLAPNAKDAAIKLLEQRDGLASAADLGAGTAEAGGGDRTHDLRFTKPCVAPEASPSADENRSADLTPGEALLTWITSLETAR